MVAPRALVFRKLVKGNETLGKRLGNFWTFDSHVVWSCSLKARQICVPVGVMSKGHWSRETFLARKGIHYSRKSIYNSAKTHQLNKRKIWTYVFKFLIWRQKWVTRVQQLALRSLSPLARWENEKIVVSFTTKSDAVPHQIKPRILELSIRRRKSKLRDCAIIIWRGGV